MFLTESERVIYGKNPLEMAICQFRFPPILRVDENPSAFQEAIRADYPLFDQKSALALPPSMVELMPAGLKIGGPAITHEFTSADGSWVVSLTREWIALTCRTYRRWSEFKEHLRLPLEAFEREYSPAFYTRIGLRYRNVIQRSELGLEGEHWSELLNGVIAGVLASSDLKGRVEQTSADLVVCDESSEDRVHIQHGLGTKQTPTSTEEIYVLDLDLFTGERTDNKNAITKVDCFNTEAGRLFRWCISNRLHQALEPASLE